MKKIKNRFYYSPEHDRGNVFNDKVLNIDWKINIKELQLSSKDLRQPLLQDVKDFFEYGVNYYV